MLPSIYLDFNESNKHPISSVKIGESWLYFFKDSLIALYNHRQGGDQLMFADTRKTAEDKEEKMLTGVAWPVGGLIALINDPNLASTIRDSVFSDIMPGEVIAIQYVELLNMATKFIAHDIADTIADEMTG